PAPPLFPYPTLFRSPAGHGRVAAGAGVARGLRAVAASADAGRCSQPAGRRRAGPWHMERPAARAARIDAAGELAPGRALLPRLRSEEHTSELQSPDH